MTFRESASITHLALDLGGICGPAPHSFEWSESLPAAFTEAARALAEKTQRSLEDALSAVAHGVLHHSAPIEAARALFADSFLSCPLTRVSRFIDWSAFAAECIADGTLLPVIHEGRSVTLEPDWS